MKNINLNAKKFNFLLERMDGKVTLSEVNKKIMLMEGVIDDIIKSAKRAPITIGGVFSPQSINIINKSLDDFYVEADKILAALKSGKSDLNLLKNSLKPEDIILANNKWKMAMSRLVDQLNLGNSPNVSTIKKNIFDYINSDGSIILNTNNLSNSQMDLIDIYQGLNMEYIDFIKHAEKIQKLTKNLTPNSNLDDVIGQLLSESGIVSLDDIKKIFYDLDEYNMRYPDDDLTDIYDIFKQRFDLTSKSSDEIITVFKKSLRDNDVYKTLDLTLRQKITKWFKTKFSKRIAEINFELGKKVDWDNSLIYYNKKEDSFYIIVTKNKGELDQVYKQVSDQGFKPRKTDGSEGPKGFGGPEMTQGEEWARRQNRQWKFYVYGIGGTILVGTATAAVYCYNRTERDLEKIKRAGDERGKTYDFGTEKTFLEKVFDCGLKGGADFTAYVIEKGAKLFKNSVLPNFLELEGSVLLWLDKKCGRPSPGKPCEKCLDCDKDFSPEEIKQIKVGGKDIDEFLSIINVTLKRDIINEYPDEAEAIIKRIEREWGEGTISKYITANGEPLPIDEMVKILCNQHSKKCVADHYNRVLSEIINAGKTQDCSTIDSYINDRISILTKYNERGLLYWGPSEKSVDISTNSNGEAINTITTDEGNTPFNGVSTVDQFIQRLVDFKNNAKELICGESNNTSDVVEFENFNTTPLELMKELWDSGDVRLNCDEWRTELTIKRKAKLKITMGTVFNDYFVKVLPNIDWYGDEWNDAFNYWWDKQRAICNITN